MTSPNRSVVVRLAMDPTSYTAGASKAAAATTALDREVAKVGTTSATSMEKAAASAGKAEGAFGKLNKVTSVLGVSLGGLAAVGGAVAAAMSVKSAGDFEQSLTKLATTAGESQKNLHMVGDGLLDMAGKVGISAGDLAKGMYTVESGGFHGANGLKVMKAAAQGAVQEQADLGKVTDAVTTILHDYHKPASDAALVTSQLVTAVSHGKTTFDELTGSLHSVTPLAAKMGISLADITGTLSAMTASGESADQATQNMANTLQHLAAPTNTMINELAQLGISTDDLATSLSTRGLAGTLQMVETAIVDHVDPATQRVLLPALNKSKSAAQDLQIMLGQMPPTLAKLSQGLADGSVTFGEYRKAVQDLGGPSSAMGRNFLALYESSQGFNSVLKAGGPAAQVFTAAMQKAFGTTAALNVALQTTGENAGSTNDAIKDIGKATGDASGNIKGWSEVQGNFNQQLHEAEAAAGALAIQFGQHLLPVLTSALGFVTHDVIPGIEHMGSALGTTAHWWSGLPQPIKETSLALAGLALAEKIGLLDKLGSSAGRVGGAFSSMTTGMGAAFTAARANQARLVAESASLWGASTAAAKEASVANAALWGSTASDVGKAGSAMDRAKGNIAGLGAAAGAAAKGGLGALKSGASSLMSVFGGPWGVALIGATLGVTALMDAIARHDAEIKRATADVQKWNEAISLGGSGQSAIQAQSHLQDLRDKLADVTAQIEKYNAAAQGGNARGGIGTLVTRQAELRSELDKGSAAWKAQLAQMTPVEEATARVQIAEHDLQMVRKNNPDNSQAVTNAEIRLQQARQSLTGETDRANAAEKTRIQQLQDSADALLGLVDANRRAQEASLGLTQQVSDYNKQIADGSLKGTALQQATLGIVDSAESAAKAAGEAAAAQAKQNGATDTGAASQAAFMKSLQDAASTMTGPAKKAILDYITQLGGQQSQAQLTAGAINDLGVTVTDLPSSHLITINVPTDDQMKKLHDLGYVTATLPDGHVVVTADTNPAISEIQDLLNYARQQSITYRSNLPDLVPGVSGGGRMGHFATGGWTGPGGKYTPAGVVHADEFVFTKEQTAKAGGPAAMYALAASIDRGFANGGWVNMPPGGWYAGQSNIPVSVDETQTKGVIGQLYKSAAAAMAAAAIPASQGAVAAIVQQMAAPRGWGSGAEWQALSNVINRESGWNPNAANPTSSARGLFQQMTSLYGPVGNVQAQTQWGLSYIGQRYGDPIGAWGHETHYGWYDDGGPLHPGLTMALNTTGKTETVRTAEQEASVQSRLRSREVWGSGVAGGTDLVAALRDALGAGGVRDFVGLAVYGDVHTDPDELARRATQRSRRLLSAAGVGR